MELVIKGAYYYDKDRDRILVPHYTGEFYIVDCDEFTTMEDLKDRYDETYIKEVKETPMEYNGKNYYSAEWSPFDIGNWELLSDLSGLEHTEEEYNW